MVDLEMFERTEDTPSRKTKIICTMGPSCWDVDKLVELIDAGMNIARLNFSHGDHEGHGACVKRIREAAAKRPDKPVAILLDTKGPEIRTGFFASGDKITLTKGQDLKLVTDYSFKGDSSCIAVSYPQMPQTVKPGGMILCADGSLVLKVKSIGPDFVVTEVMNGCSIGERKNCNLPGVKVDLPVLQEKDKNDLVNFGIPNDVDFVAASFVQCREDIDLIRATLGEAGKRIQIISKIENEEGLKNFDDILRAGDGIMVARGDLGMEIPPEKVFLAQKCMIAKCNIMGKPVVTATQMLESMTSAPRPTRAEAGDVANAVLDGTDCVMLSGETAGGAFPIEACTIMRRIAEEAEKGLCYTTVLNRTRDEALATAGCVIPVEATCSSACKAAHDLKSPLIVCITQTGFAATMIAKYRPQAIILAISKDSQTVRQLRSIRGVQSRLATGDDVDAMLKDAFAYAKEKGLVSSGDPCVTVHGANNKNPFARNATSVMKVFWLDKESPGNVNANSLNEIAYGQCPLRLPKNMGDLELFERTEDTMKRKCKIICTMGPSCWDVDKLVQLIDAGMNICRLNFSHGDHEGHGACVKRIREAAKQRPDKPVAILLDTKGPEIRTGFFASGDKIKLTKGQDLKLVTDYSFKGDNTCIAVSYPKMPQTVKAGGMILCADGSLVLKVKSIGADFVMTEVCNDCSIGERKNCNLPGVKVDLPVLQEKDKNDLLNFGIPQDVDYVAASFVQCKEDVQMIREVLGEAGKNIKIISKIENEEALKNFDEIAEATDGVMVARGDLGMEIPPEKVFLAQKCMIAKCNLAGKPVVTATQMLESMTKAPRPTRAEAGDVANAVLDGTDCVMLSGETAGGDFPLEAVSVMRRIVQEAELSLDYPTMYSMICAEVHASEKFARGAVSQSEAIASAVVKTAADVGSPLIVSIFDAGVSARHLAKYRPQATILAVTPKPERARKLYCLRGVVTMIADTSGDQDVVMQNAIAYASKLGLVSSGDNVVGVCDQKEPGLSDSNSKLVKLVIAA
jgi:pyruvate kinase